MMALNGVAKRTVQSDRLWRTHTRELEVKASKNNLAIDTGQGGIS